MAIFKLQYSIFTLSLVLLSGCSFFGGESSRDWADFIPGEESNKNIFYDQEICSKEGDSCPPSKALSNGQVFPDDCDWEALARVVDGDTLVLESDERVRFIGIDTPETKHPSKDVQPFGLEASQMTKDLLESSSKVCLINSEIGDEYDMYGRRLAYVFSEFGIDINVELLRSGVAKGYFGFLFDRRDEFKAIEAKAKMERRNLWQ